MHPRFSGVSGDACPVAVPIHRAARRRDARQPRSGQVRGATGGERHHVQAVPALGPGQALRLGRHRRDACRARLPSVLDARPVGQPGRAPDRCHPVRCPRSYSEVCVAPHPAQSRSAVANRDCSAIVDPRRPAHLDLDALDRPRSTCAADRATAESRPPETAMDHSVFISYSSADKSAADQICAALEPPDTAAGWPPAISGPAADTRPPFSRPWGRRAAMVSAS